MAKEKDNELTIAFPDAALRDRGVLQLAKDYGWQPTVKQKGLDGQPPVVQDNPVSAEAFAKNIIADMFKKAIAREDGRIAAAKATEAAEEAARNLQIG